MLPKMLVVLMLLGVPAAADLYDDYLHSSSKRPFVSLFARSLTASSPGHSFVGIGVELDNGMIVYERFMGLYPDGNGLKAFKSVFSPVAGDIRQDFKDISWSMEYRIYVDEARHAAAIKIADEWRQETPKYSLIAKGGANCNVFASEIAKAIGLRVPDGAGMTLPQIYMSKIRKRNDD